MPSFYSGAEMRQVHQSRRNLLRLASGATILTALGDRDSTAKPSRVVESHPASSVGSNLLEEIGAALKVNGVIDVHEHLLGRKQREERDPDLFGWIAESYLLGDLIAAGMDTAILTSQEIGLEKKWSELEHFLPLINHTGYMKASRQGWRDFCGMEGFHLERSNWKAVNAAIRKNNHKEPLSEAVLVHGCSMKQILVDRQVGGTTVHFLSQGEELDWYNYLLKVRPKKSDEFIANYTKERETDRPYLRKVIKIDSLEYGWLKQSAAENRQLMGVDTSAARTLADYAQLVEIAIEKALAGGAVGLKTAQSGWRSLRFDPADFTLAEAALQKPLESLGRKNIIAFENFVIREVIKSAARHHLPLQIHTGSAFGPHGRFSRATDLSNLIQEFPGTTFVVMHASWPFWHEVEELGKRYPNVRLDLSWLIAVSPLDGQRMLESMFATLPANKMVWGGDCVYVEETYGTFLQARRVVAEALASLVESKVLDREAAIDLAVGIFCKNALGIWRL